MDTRDGLIKPGASEGWRLSYLISAGRGAAQRHWGAFHVNTPGEQHIRCNVGVTSEALWVESASERIEIPLRKIEESAYIKHPFSGHEVKVTLRNGEVYLFKEIERLRAARTLFDKLPGVRQVRSS